MQKSKNRSKVKGQIKKQRIGSTFLYEKIVWQIDEKTLARRNANSRFLLQRV